MWHLITLIQFICLSSPLSSFLFLFLHLLPNLFSPFPLPSSPYFPCSAQAFHDAFSDFIAWLRDTERKIQRDDPLKLEVEELKTGLTYLQVRVGLVPRSSPQLVSLTVLEPASYPVSPLPAPCIHSWSIPSLSPAGYSWGHSCSWEGVWGVVLKVPGAGREGDARCGGATAETGQLPAEVERTSGQKSNM